MGICPKELREYIIRPTLQHLNAWSPAAENLLLGTAAQASGLGFHLRQGVGIGLFQIDAEMHQYIWDRYLALDPDLASKVRGIASQHEFLAEPHQELASNLAYATAIAWMIYRCANITLPTDPDNIEALAQLWFCYFPRHHITHTTAEFVRHYKEIVLEDKDEPKNRVAA
jgi:hypothetical protein